MEIEENLIANGSFEIVSVDWPDGFGRFTGAGTPVFAVDSQVKRTGERSISITADKDSRGNTHTSVGVEGDASYRLTVWYRATEGIEPGDIIVRLQAYDGDNNKVNWDLDWVYDRSEVDAHVASGNLSINPLSTVTPGDTWQSLTASFTVPANVTKISIDLWNWYGEGTVWYDDLSLVPVKS